MIEEKFVSGGLVVVDWLGRKWRRSGAGIEVEVRWRYESKSDVAALMAATGERRGHGAAGADGRNAGASGLWREHSYDGMGSTSELA